MACAFFRCQGRADDVHESAGGYYPRCRDDQGVAALAFPEAAGGAEVALLRRAPDGVDHLGSRPDLHGARLGRHAAFSIGLSTVRPTVRTIAALTCSHASQGS